jgi:uncharacterized protein (DUF58 family)
MEGQETGVPSLFTATLIQLFVGVLLFVALLNNQRELIVLTLLVLGVVGGARLWARMSLSGLQCHLKVDRQRVFPGEQVTLTISAENTKLLPIWLKVLVPISGLLQQSTEERVLTKASSLLWFQRTQFQWKLIAERRGVYQLGPLNILAGDLFSFFTRQKQLEESHSLIVYPRLVSLKPFSLPRRDFFGVPRATSPVQDPIYILGTRDYQHGQPSRFIHWKASARHQRLQEKIFEPTVQEKVLLAVDVDSFARRDAEEELERVLEVVASLAVRLDRQGHSVGFVANGAVKGAKSAIVPVARDEQHLSDILQVLARLEMKSDSDLKDLLRRGLADAWGISCVYFSYQEDATVFFADEFFAQRNTPVIFFVCRPPTAAGENNLEIQRKVYRLDEIRATEIENG